MKIHKLRVEWFLVFDITCEVWELLRLRGLKARVLHAELLRALTQEVNVGYVNHINADEPKPPWLAQFRRMFVGVLAGDPAAKLRIEKFLEPEGLTLESLLASAFWRKIETQVSADRLVESAYQRRNALYDDLERVRSKAQRTGNLPPTVQSPSVAEGDEQGAPAKRVENVAGEDARGGQP
jgi:hypothetical protein